MSVPQRSYSSSFCSNSERRADFENPDDPQMTYNYSSAYPSSSGIGGSEHWANSTFMRRVSLLNCLQQLFSRLATRVRWSGQLPGSRPRTTLVCATGVQSAAARFQVSRLSYTSFPWRYDEHAAHSAAIPLSWNFRPCLWWFIESPTSLGAPTPLQPEYVTRNGADDVELEQWLGHGRQYCCLYE
jgi:hypothetical protein